MNDLINMTMHRAARRYSQSGKMLVFNSATFSTELAKLATVKNAIDGHIVIVILAGRNDVERLAGGCHWRIIENDVP